MILSIAILVLSVLLTVMQFLKQSVFGLKTAASVASLLVLLGAWSVFDQNREREQYIAALERIATRIDWHATEAYLDVLNEPSAIAPGGVSAIVKIVQPTSPQLRAMLNKGDVQGACTTAGLGVSTLPKDVAERLFRALENPSGSTAIDDERKAGIEHLFYSGERSVPSPGGNARVKLTLDRGPIATSGYRALSDLNGKLMVALLQAPPESNPFLSSLELDLKTESGRFRLSLSAPLALSRSPSNGSVLTGGSQRYVGVCIPQGLFRSADD